MRKLTLLVLLLVTLPAFGRLPRLVLPQHYDLTITPDLEHEQFAGEEVITVSVQQPVRSIQLNSAEIVFRKVWVQSGTEAQEAKAAVDPDTETVTLSFPKPLPIGPATIRIAYDGTLNGQLRGFYIGESGGKKYVGSQMESTDARRAFPSFDEPDMKATFRLTVIADAKHNVISNAAVESETPGPVAGKKTVRFAATPRLSTYHIALIVGDFACLSDSVQGIPLRVCASPDKIESGRFALNATKDILTFFNEYFDMDYPFGKLDQIALADFAAGAMENPGAITYRERILLNDEKTSSPEALRGSVSTIAHEIAHMWFGDLVTMRWWDDIWLNEGFASWMGRKGTEAVRPQWKQTIADVDAASSPMKSDILASTRAIHQSAEIPAEIEQLFDSIAYGKTAALLRMLESYAGPEKFRSGVNLYLQRNAYSNASASDFAAATAEKGGAEIVDILSSYVNQPGIPLVSVRTRCDGDSTVVDLQQQRFSLRSGTAMSGQLWTIPVCFTGGDCVLLRERQATFRLPKCRTDAFANAEGRGFYITSYDTAATQQLARSTALTPSEKVAMLRDAWLLVRSGKGTVPAFLDLATSLKNERAAAREILTDVGFIEQHLANAADRAAIQRWLRNFSDPLSASLGATARSGDSADDRELRNAIIVALAEHGGTDAIAKRAREFTEQWLKDRTSVDPSVVAETIKAAAINGDVKLYDALFNAYRTSRNARERSDLLAALANFHEPVLISRTLQLALMRDVRSQDIASVLANTLENPAATEIAWTFLDEHWVDIARKLPPGHADRIISAAGQAVCDAAWRDRIKAFAAKWELRDATTSTAQAMERVEACSAMRATQQTAISGWLREHAE